MAREDSDQGRMKEMRRAMGNAEVVEVPIPLSEVKEWVGGLYIEFQLARKKAAQYQQQAQDYQQALTQARLELQELKARETDNGD